MGKKKKTLKQKKLTEQRLLSELHGKGQQEEQAAPHASPTFSYTFTNTKQVSLPSYSLKHDLRKTLIVSSAILLFLIVFSEVLHNLAHMLPLVSLRY